MSADRVDEMVARLANIERKVDRLVARDVDGAAGHPDQLFGGFSYAQHGDDMIALCLFHSMGISRPSYLDIGAHHPTDISNTALMYKRGCRGINVEPNPNLFKEFLLKRPDDINLNVGVAGVAGRLTFYMIDERSGRNTFDKEVAEAFVAKHSEFSIRNKIDIDVITINDIVNNYFDGNFPDFLSIDVEGLDVEIVESMDVSRSRPKVVCVEVDNALGSATGTKIRTALTSRGYVCVIRAVSNLFFVDRACLVSVT